MTQIEALLEIALAINRLATAMGGIWFVLWIFLLCKKMD